MKTIGALLASHVIDLAARIAPPSRKDWAAAMRAELPHLETGQWSWAMGSLLTACGENLGAQTTAGRLRLLAGILVIGLGLMVFPVTMGGNPMALPIGVFNPLQPLIFTVLASVTGLLLFGGASLLLARLSPPMASAGRWLFGFGGLGFAVLQFSIVLFGVIGPYPFGWVQVDAALATFAFAGAGVALIARLERTYWTLAMLALAYGLSGAAHILAYRDGHDLYFLAVNALNMFMPSPLLLAGGAPLPIAKHRPVES